MVHYLFWKSALLVSITYFRIAFAVNGECAQPSVRREWRTLSDDERADWITAVKCLGQMPHNDSLTPVNDPVVELIPPVNMTSSYYDDFVYVHMDFTRFIHGTGQFLPWHRAYLNDFENALRSHCGYNGSQPYWDWTQDTDDFLASPIFDPSLTSGLGEWGDPDNDMQITSGGFSVDFSLAYPVPHLIRRNYTLQPWINLPQIFIDGSLPPQDRYQLATSMFTRESQDALVSGFSGDLRAFQTMLESVNGSHAAVHRIVGLDMFGACPASAPAGCIPGPKWSANDPLFFLHHAMVDKLWNDWQHYDEANFWAFFGGSLPGNQNMTRYILYPNGAPPFLNLDSSILTDGLMVEATVRDVMNITGGHLCYVYE